jgi:hypothetical protein
MSEWISVDDNIPHLDGYGMDEGEGISDCVLMLYSCNDDNSGMIYRRVGHCLKLDGKIVWSLAECLTWNSFPKDHENILNVTHWMPLPEIPNDHGRSA